MRFKIQYLRKREEINCSGKRDKCGRRKRKKKMGYRKHIKALCFTHVVLLERSRRNDSIYTLEDYRTWL
jgi:hypothetical protein